MKMTKESYQLIKRDIVNNLELVAKHSEWLQAEGKFKVFNTRLSWDVYHGVATKETKDNIRLESLNDSHITTALTKALTELNIIGGKNV